MKRVLAICVPIILAASPALAQEAPSAAEGAAPAADVSAPAPPPLETAGVDVSAPAPAPSGTAAAAAPIQTSNPCADVSCAGHGKCVVKGGEPMCACDNGYVPDATTGLSCQRNLKAASLASSKMQALLQLPQPKRVEEVLQRDLSNEYAEYQAGPSDKSFTEFMYGKYVRKRNAGIGVLVPGLVLACSIGAFMIPANNIETQRKEEQLEKLKEENPDALESELKEQVDENYEPSSAETGLIIGGAVVGVLGMTATIVGSVIVGKARRKMRHIGRLLETEQLLEPEAARVEVTPILYGTAHSAQAGLVVEF